MISPNIPTPSQCEAFEPEAEDRQRENFSNHRDYERELRTVSANIDMILGKNREREQQIEKGKDL